VGVKTPPEAKNPVNVLLAINITGRQNIPLKFRKLIAYNIFIGPVLCFAQYRFFYFSVF